MIRKVKLVLLLLILLPLGLMAQQKPQYTQYIFNNFLLNPALSGMENYTDLKIGHRQQWAGINGAPKTSFISAHWVLGDRYLWRNALSLPENGDPPMGRNYMQNYTSSPAHHGVGFMAVNDKAGPLSFLNVALTYAYHLKVNDALNLSVGTAVGINRASLDINELLLEEQNDPALSNARNSQLKPDLSVGLWLYGARFFAGASVQQILPQEVSFSSTSNHNTGTEVAHVFATAGYKLFIDDEISATSSVMLKWVGNVPLSYDANLKVSFRDRFWLGGSYRKNDSFAALAGVNFNNVFNLTYAYDYTTSSLRSYTSGSHEIVLGFQLNNMYRVLSTQRMW
jgi:type IX secretion system PorP/SprF family membrane protein